MNDGIAEKDCIVKYTSFDDAVQQIALSGRSTQMTKADIQSAFRLLLVRLQDFNLLGMKAGGFYFIDKSCPMGAATAPAVFETFSTFIEWAAQAKIVHGYSQISLLVAMQIMPCLCKIYAMSMNSFVIVHVHEQWLFCFWSLKNGLCAWSKGMTSFAWE